jgi:hypothetical protein
MQLLACTAETTEALGQPRQQLPEDSAWLLLQPVLRLLLWLLPEHVPQPYPQLHQGPGSPRISAAAQAPVPHRGSVKDQDPQTLSGSGDRQHSLGLDYAREIVEVGTGIPRQTPVVWLAVVSKLPCGLALPPLATCGWSTLAGLGHSVLCSQHCIKPSAMPWAGSLETLRWLNFQSQPLRDVISWKSACLGGHSQEVGSVTAHMN